MYNSYIMMENVMQSWEEMTVLEQMQCQFWDMYKDAYGVRPRGIDTTSWTEADFEAEFQMLGKVIEQEDIARKEAEAEAIVAKFEQRVTNTYTALGATRSCHVLLRLAHGCRGELDGDCEYFCFTQGLPYGYFKEAA
jgi:hypothetical protein